MTGRILLIVGMALCAALFFFCGCGSLVVFVLIQEPAERRIYVPAREEYQYEKPVLPWPRPPLETFPEQHPTGKWPPPEDPLEKPVSQEHELKGKGKK